MTTEEPDGPTKRFRVWHVPQVPMTPFYVCVDTEATARLVAAVLAEYDLFQFNHSVKPDYSNAQGVEVFEDGEWVEVDDD